MATTENDGNAYKIHHMSTFDIDSLLAIYSTEMSLCVHEKNMYKNVDGKICLKKFMAVLFIIGPIVEKMFVPSP